MAFTNIWDDTIPADTQLANLLGQDLRNFRIDAQQRMAAISGLDAGKPNFAGDAQPAAWNGILFFATDTGIVYQFNNPSWTAVSLNSKILPIQGPTFGGNIIPATTTIWAGALSYSAITEGSVQAITPGGGVFKSIYISTTTSQPGTGTMTFTLRIGGVSQGLILTLPINSVAGVYSASAAVPFAAGVLYDIQITNNAASNSASIQSIALGY